MVRVCLALVGVGLLISWPMTAMLVRAGHRFGWLDRIGGEAHKRHERVVPNTGGIAIFLAVGLPLLAGLVAVWVVPAGVWGRYLPAIGPHLEGLQRMTPMGAGVLLAMAALHVVGLVDDRRALGPFVKLIAQLLVAAGLVIGLDMRVLELLSTPWGLAGTAVSAAVSIAWIVVIINAFNFLDNMDGLCGGVGAIIAGLYLAATLLNGQWFVAALAALLLGALVGFLAFNVPPAKLFMGDGGSLVLGLLLAVISMRTTYFEPGAPPGNSEVTGLAAGSHWYGLLMPLVVMAVPLYDFVSVTLIRLAQGKSPFKGDHQHFSHRLVKLGLSRRRAVGVIWLCTLATGLSGVMLGSLDRWQAMLAAGQTAAVLAVLAVLEHGAGKSGRYNS